MAAAAAGFLCFLQAHRATRTHEELQAQGKESQLVASRSTSQLPHVLLILADDVGWNDIGYQSIDMLGITPNIDEYAKEGIKLGNLYGAHLCTPARASLLTGRLPHRTGLSTGILHAQEAAGLPLRFKLLPEYLKDVGYSTHMIGKWHLGFYEPEYLPTYRGFDTYYGYVGDKITYDDHIYPISINGDHFQDFMAARHTEYEKVQDNETYSSVLFTQRAKRLIDQHDSINPLFIYLALQNAHTPFLNVSGIVNFTSPQQDDLLNMLPEARREFAESIVMLDWSVTQVIEAFKARQMYDNLLVIFASDNGACNSDGGSTAPFRGGKQTLWEGGVRVPGFITGGFLPSSAASSTYPGLMHLADIMATILGQVGVTAEDIDGLDQWEAILNTGRESPRDNLVYNINLNATTEPVMAIRNARYKYIYNEMCDAYYYQDYKRVSPPSTDICTGTYENMKEGCVVMSTVEYTGRGYLFDLVDDPLETTDISSKFPEIANKMHEQLLLHILEWEPVVDGEMETNIAHNYWEKTGYMCPWVTKTEGIYH